MSFLNKLFSKQPTAKKQLNDIVDAANWRDLEKAKSIVNANPSVVEAVDDDGMTALHFVAATRAINIAEFLIAKGAKISPLNKTGWTPLHFAAHEGYTDMAKLLLSHGAHLGVKDNSGNTPLDIAREYKRGDLESYLLSQGAQQPESQVVAQQKPLESGMKDVSTKEPSEAVDVLLGKALDATPYVTTAEVLRGYQNLEKAWGSRQLFVGDSAEIRAVILLNLNELAAKSEFEKFVVTVLRNQPCAQVMAMFSTKTFTGVRVWHTQTEICACGNSAFHALELSAADEATRRLVALYRARGGGFSRESIETEEIRSIGEELNRIGGIALMREVHKAFAHSCKDIVGAARNLELRWNGIGLWLG
jgi:hypothetical protein